MIEFFNRRVCMHLKRLETVGFKSFADRVDIDFVPGVTAIVGPNGSGKSNITDAIRWVLGEQSVRSLRGSRMEDIIFQGSDTRNPLNVAEVTLVLDNSDQTLPLDYEEVSVTRRVYRSGASEFYINKQSCRLKDIVDLFMDSGLGREAFSIISQGKVEEILSSKEEDRRVIFEEAAGVLKYKQRKQEAEFKLAETEENLFRVDDILYEIKQQLAPLKEQAQLAERYLAKREELKKHEISLLITEIEQLHRKWETLRKEIEEEKIKGLKQKSDIHTLEAQIEVARNNIHKIDEEIEVLQEKLLTATQRLEQQEGRKKLVDERSKHFLENKKILQHEQQQLKETIQSLTEKYEGEKETLNKLLEERQQIKHKISSFNEQLSTKVESIEEKIADLKAEYIELLNEQAAKRNEVQTTDERLRQLGEEEQKLKDKYELYKREQNFTEGECRELLQKTEVLKKDYEEKQVSIEKQQKKLAFKKQQIFTDEQRLNKGYQKIARLNSRKEVLQEMMQEYQGFYHGVRSVLKARERNELMNIYGAVVELINIPDQYIDAMETILGGQSQYIVVEDERSARAAINYLKRTNNGRATFLPLQILQPRKIPEALLSKVRTHSGFVNIASKVVKTEEKFRIVAEHLMGNILIAKTLKDANEIAKLLQRRYRIVTLEGDVVFPGGSMSGGAKKRTNHSLFTREKELEQTVGKLQNYEQRAEQFKQKIEREKVEVKSLEERLEVFQEELKELASELQKYQTKYQTRKLQLKTIMDQLEALSMDREQLGENETRYRKRREILDEELKQIKQLLTKTQQTIANLTEEQNTFKENREQLSAEIHRLEILLAELEERIKNQQHHTKSLYENLQNAQDAYTKNIQQLQTLLAEQEEQATIEQITEQIDQEQRKKEQLMKQIQERRQKRLKLTKTLTDDEREVSEKNKLHDQFVEKLQQKEVRSNRLDVELENRLSQLQTEYTISFERAKERYDRTDQPEKTKKIVERLKQKINSLGRVNLGAIDEYKRISERYNFLSEQKEDLEQAKASLFDVIAEMDEEMKARFEETFTKIQKEFSIVFKELFGGGRAQLKLTDPDNLLDTGIEIVAQPPGKKLQQLGLLSGGERALTAISLLFAILRVRPVPFCVLDEVEAALDETNVVRFAKYVKMHSEETQFIVITHRKGTMEEADVLYGVTMQESGVSRLVSVRLEDADELIEV